MNSHSIARPLLAGVIVSLIVVFGAAGWSVLASEAGSTWPDAETSSWSSPQPSSPTDSTLQGRWEARRIDGRLKLRLHTGDRLHHSSTTLRVDDRELEHSGAGFVVSRDAGRFQFNGTLSATGEQAGSGSFSFAPDPDFRVELQRLGVSGLDPRHQYVLAACGVDLGWVRTLVDQGYHEISANTLVAVGIHEVRPEFIRALSERGLERLSLHTLLAMRIHGATPEYVDEMAAIGFGGMDAGQLIAWRVHGVSPEYLREMAAWGMELDPAQATAFRVHGVSGEYLEEMRQLGLELDAAHAIAFRVHGVSGEYLEEMRRLGLELDAAHAIAFRVHNVNAEFVEAIQAQGYPDPDPALLIAARVHDLTPGYLERLHREGRRDISLRDAIELKVWGHEP
jgi:hypothetical protein